MKQWRVQDTTAPMLPKNYNKNSCQGKYTQNDRNTGRPPAGYYYCWTYGLRHTNMRKLEHAHTSATCTYPAKGHNKNATLAHINGGNTNI